MSNKPPAMARSSTVRAGFAGLLFCAGFFLPHFAQAEWYNDSWNYRVEVTVDNTNVDDDLTDFPVYVDLSDLPAGFHTNVKSDGGDIRVTTSDGETEVPREVVFYDAGTDTGELHFKGTLANSTDTVFYIYYGNSGASDLAVDATNGAENVWTSGYKAVYHLQQDPSGTVTDSTTNDNDLAGANMASSNQVAAALAGFGYSFNGTDERLADTDQVWLNADNAITIQYWNHVTAAAAAETNASAVAYTASGSERTSTHAPWASIIYFDFGTCCSGQRANGSYNAYDDKWTMVHHTSDGSTRVRTFLDGVKTYFSDTTADNPNTDLTGFNVGGGGDSTWFHNGSLDEVRVSTVERTAEWVATEYDNQSDAGTFYTAGAQEEVPSTWYNDSWPYRVEVTVDNTNVDDDLTDFPVYVDLSDLPAGFHTNVKSDGGDIRVTTSDGTTEVPREVVFYDAGTDTGELHFKGTLANSSDTVFYIYYGNSGASDYATDATNGAENVWNDAYKGIYHLPDGSTLDVSDSTATQDGTNSSATASTGKLDGSVNVVSSQYIDLGQTGAHYNPITVSAWIKPSSTGSTQQQIISKGFDGTNTQWQLVTDSGSTVSFNSFTNPNVNGATSAGTVSNGTWYYAVGVYDGTTWRVYLNGSPDGSSVDTAPTNTNQKIAIGGVFSSGSIVQNWRGDIDEARISNVVRSAEWIATEYDNQNDPGTFYTLGAQEANEEEAPARVIRLKGGIRLLPGLRLR